MKMLTGDTVLLVPPTPDDLPLFASWLSDLDTLRLLAFQPAVPLTIADEEAWFASLCQASDNQFVFAIRHQEDKRLLGNCGLVVQNWRSRQAELGIFIGQARGQGFGGDALRVLLRFGFDDLNLNRIALQVYSYNPRAVALYERLGFVHEGTLREAIQRDGRFYDIYVMSILRDEWEG